MIGEALRAQVGDAVPSPHVWKRIRRQAVKWTVRQRRGLAWSWNASSPLATQADIVFSRPVVLRGDIVYYRHDLATARFLGYGAMMLRFGW